MAPTMGDANGDIAPVTFDELKAVVDRAQGAGQGPGLVGCLLAASLCAAGDEGFDSMMALHLLPLMAAFHEAGLEREADDYRERIIDRFPDVYAVPESEAYLLADPDDFDDDVVAHDDLTVEDLDGIDA